MVTSITADARTYRVDALVLAVNPGDCTFLAAHRPIPGYMPAMTMSLRVRNAAELTGLEPGTRVEFDLDVDREGHFAQRIRKTALADPDLVRPALPIGTTIPDSSLTDQIGRTLRLSDLRGKVVALQFIYTRCPLAEVCPRMAASFATLQRRFETGLALVSVSLDPRHDTPAVLAGYAKLWRAKPDIWRFVTGDPEAVEKVASNFGVVYWPEDGALTHTAKTALIDRDGRLAALVDGSSYRTDQLLELVRHLLEVRQ